MGHAQIGGRVDAEGVARVGVAVPAVEGAARDLDADAVTGGELVARRRHVDAQLVDLAGGHRLPGALAGALAEAQPADALLHELRIAVGPDVDERDGEVRVRRRGAHEERGLERADDFERLDERRRDVAEHVRPGHDVPAIGERPGRGPSVFADPVVGRGGRVVVEVVGRFGGGRLLRQPAAGPQVELREPRAGQRPLGRLAPAVGAEDVGAHAWRLREVVALSVAKPVVEEKADAIVGDPLRVQLQTSGPPRLLRGQLVIGGADGKPLVLAHRVVHVALLDAPPALERPAQEVVVPAGPVKHRDVELGPQLGEVVPRPELVALGAGHRQIVEMAGQAGGPRQVLQRQVCGVEPQPVDVAAMGLVADPQTRGLQAEGAALEEQAVEVEPHVTRGQAAQGRMKARGRGPLREREVRLADHADLAVAPGLRSDPGDGVVAVVGLVNDGGPFALRLELAAHVLDDAHVSLARPVAAVGGHRGVGFVLAVGEADEDGREALFARPAVRIRRPVHVRRQAHAVAHRHHHAALLDDPGVTDRELGRQLALGQPHALVELDQRPDRRPLEVGAAVAQKALAHAMLCDHARLVPMDHTLPTPLRPVKARR